MTRGPIGWETILAVFVLNLVTWGIAVLILAAVVKWVFL